MKKKLFFKNHEKKSPSRPFLAHSAGGQETTFYLRVASSTKMRNLEVVVKVSLLL